MNKELILEAKNAIITKVKENKKAAISIGAAVIGAFAVLFCVASNEKPISSQPSELPEMTSFKDQLQEQNLIDDMANCNSVLAEAYEVPQSFLLKCDGYYQEAFSMQLKWKVRPRLIEEMNGVEKNLKRFIGRN
jgi:hypothetical protein|nr:MAG TPA: hypothetical protein [Caudoviricetes sp.]